jgi:hypothetical protein
MPRWPKKKKNNLVGGAVTGTSDFTISELTKTNHISYIRPFNDIQEVLVARKNQK